jgi:hypothetical protein
VLAAEGPEASLAAPLRRDVAWRAAITAASATGAWLLARPLGAARAGTVSLAALVGTQLGQTLVSGGTNPAVLGASLGSLGVLVGVVQTPGVSGFFGCTPLGPVGWAAAVTTSTLAVAVGALLPGAADTVERWVARVRAGSGVPLHPPGPLALAGATGNGMDCDDAAGSAA